MTQHAAAMNLTTMLAQLEKQAQLAHELADAARRHRDIVEDGEAPSLLSHLTARQHLVSEIERGQSALDRHVALLEEKLSAATAEQRARVFGLIDSIRTSLTDVLAVDAADSGRIASRLKEAIGQNSATEGHAT
jgi:hypothetical protein